MTGPTFGLTPESLLAGLKRNDSKNPHTTCRGITTSGRPCRRSLAAAVNGLNKTQAEDEQSSVVAMLQENEVGSEITAFFCWQHKDQADDYHVGVAKKVELRTRSSLEDMLSNMGLQDTKELGVAKPKRSKPAHTDHHRRIQQPLSRYTQVSASGVATDIISDFDRETNVIEQHKNSSRDANSRRDYEPRRKRHKDPSLLEMMCGCFIIEDRSLETVQPVKPRPQRPGPRTPQEATSSERHARSSFRASPNPRHDSKLNTPTASPGAEDRLHKMTRQDSEPIRSDKWLPVPQQRPHLSETHSQPVIIRKPLADQPTERNKRRASTEDHASTASAQQGGRVPAAYAVIPQDASLMLASNLMAEMSKVAQDPREGYIYMYWLDSAQSAVADDAGESLLASSPPRKSSRLATHASPGKILLKIGRAENVYSRLSQWQRQCGYKPLLVRSYPRDESDARVQHLHRVERLIHLELAEQNVKRQCSPCGKEHREWFEVNGRQGVREVDKVIEKWIAWSSKQPMA